MREKKKEEEENRIKTFKTTNQSLLILQTTNEIELKTR